MTQGWELELDREAFLARHWQKEPLLIRNAIPGFTPPVNADELAGLAMEAEVESRIIEHRDERWQLHHGPFVEDDFRRGDTAWTLLVQAVDHYLPEVAELKTLFDFIPSWRLDDVMVSYANDRGGVGPHYDNYDVFLLQGEGKRLWRLGQYCSPGSELLPNDDLRILSEFETCYEYLLSPGDMLYVPPRVAHWGIARGECTTFSIGFRAPRLNEMVSRWIDRLLEQMEPEEFYHDAGQEPAVRPGEIRPRDMDRVMAQVQAALDQGEDSTWFGELVTEPRYDPPLDEGDYEQARAELAGGQCDVWRDPASKLAWQRQADAIYVFANGDSKAFAAPVLPCVERLCGDGKLSAAELHDLQAVDGVSALLDYLMQRGCIYVE